MLFDIINMWYTGLNEKKEKKEVVNMKLKIFEMDAQAHLEVESEDVCLYCEGIENELQLKGFEI